MTRILLIVWRQEEFGIILILNFQTMVPRHSLDISIKYSYVPQVRPSCFFSDIFPFLSSLHDMMVSCCLHVFYVFSLFSGFVIDQWSVVLQKENWNQMLSKVVLNNSEIIVIWFFANQNTFHLIVRGLKNALLMPLVKVNIAIHKLNLVKVRSSQITNGLQIRHHFGRRKPPTSWTKQFLTSTLRSRRR